MARSIDVIVEAAGGVLWRDRKQLELLVIHRPAYDDWTFPKGKRDVGDADLQHTARREIREETGLSVALGDRLIEIEYVDRKGRYKHVTYWEARVLTGAFRPNREVDVARWMPVGRVHEVLSYDRDRQVLAAFRRWHVGVAPVAAERAG